MPVVTIPVSKDIYESVKAYAKRTGKKLYRCVDQALKEWLERVESEE